MMAGDNNDNAAYVFGEYAGCVPGATPGEIYFECQSGSSTVAASVPLAPEFQQAPPSFPEPSAPPLPADYLHSDFADVAGSASSASAASAQAEVSPDIYTQSLIAFGFLTQSMWDNLNASNKACFNRENSWPSRFENQDSFYNVLRDLKPYISFLTEIKYRMQALPEFSKKRMMFTHLINELEHDLLPKMLNGNAKRPIATEFINNVKKLAATHRDTGLTGVAKFTFLRKPQSAKLLNNIRKGRTNLAR